MYFDGVGKTLLGDELKLKKMSLPYPKVFFV
jgi:hypothetical protein